jgi:hypothetical protein
MTVQKLHRVGHDANALNASSECHIVTDSLGGGLCGEGDGLLGTRRIGS